MVQLPAVDVDAVVSGIGTGGTLVGLYRRFTKAVSDTLSVAAIPCGGAGEFISNMECSSLRFSKDVPRVIDGCSQFFSE